MPSRRNLAAVATRSGGRAARSLLRALDQLRTAVDGELADDVAEIRAQLDRLADKLAGRGLLRERPEWTVRI